MRLPREFRLARRNFRHALKIASQAMGGPWAPAPFASSLVEADAFGSNPGNLRMLIRTPERPVRPGAPLIVLLHGCGQDPLAFAADSGWIALASRLGVPLVIPAQRPENNASGCFNWFRLTDTRRGRGEALSIRQMVAHAATRLRSDTGRIFIVGLSAGGAMTASMLAAYPDVFAAGAIVAGLPAGCAASVSEALGCMSACPTRTPQEWAERARALGRVRERAWPRVSIWHGERDHTVARGNAEALVAQWTFLHGLAGTAPHAEAGRQFWGDARFPSVEARFIPHLGHAFPIDPAEGGSIARWIENAGICAALEIARFWGIAAPAADLVRAAG